MCRISNGTTNGVAPTLLLHLGPAQYNMMGKEVTGEQHPVPPTPLSCVWCCTGERACRFLVVAELSCNGRLEIERLDNKDSSSLLSTSTPFSCTRCPFGSFRENSVFIYLFY